MLDYQQKIDSERIEKKRTRETKDERRLRHIYREASKLYHPDVNKSIEAGNIMKTINGFYEKKDYHSIKNLMDKSTHSV